MSNCKAIPQQKDIQKRAFSFACRIVNLYKHLANKPGPAEALCRQILRSGTSIGANLEEATAGQSKADFLSKCNIALKEARETYYWLRLLIESKVVSEKRLSTIADESNQIVAILTAIVKKSKSSNNSKF